MSDRRNRIIYIKASPALIADLHTWIGKQLVKPSIAATVEAAIREFLQNHPLLK